MPRFPQRVPPGIKKVVLAAAILVFVQVGPPSLGAQSENPWNFVQDFTLVPGSIVQVEEHYVAALFRNIEKGLSAVVVYTAQCGSGICTIESNVAYAVYDAQGANIRHYVDPGEGRRINAILNSQPLI